MKVFKIFIFLFLFNTETFTQILVMVPVYNRPDFIELQYKTFKKFLKDEYELVIFSDAKTDNMHNQISQMCDKYNLRCIRVPQGIHELPYLPRPAAGFSSEYQSATVRNCNVVQYALNTIGFQHDDVVAIVDSDVFLIKEFSIKDYLGQALLAGPRKQCSAWPPHHCNKLHPDIKPFSYFWAGLIFFDMKNLPNKNTINLNCGYLYGKIAVDTGGFLHYYLRDNSAVAVKFFDKTNFQKLLCNKCKVKQKAARPCTHNIDILMRYGLNHKDITFVQSMPLPGVREGRHIEFILNGTFMHSNCGSNHLNLSHSFENIKTKLLSTYFEELLKS